MATPAEFTGPVNLGNPNEFTHPGARGEESLRFTGSRSKIEMKPLPADDPTQRQPDIALARKHLGWEPKVQLEAGLQMTIGYFESLLGNAVARLA